MNTQSSSASTHTIRYAISDIARKAASFIMLPVYTRYLTPADYGVVELLVMVLLVAQIIFGFKVGQAVVKFHVMSNDNDEKKRILSTAFFSSMVVSALGAAVIIFISERISLFAFEDASLSYAVSIFALILVIQGAEEYGLLHLRIVKNSKSFLYISLAKLLLQVALNIYFIVFLSMGVKGVVYSALLSSSVFGLIMTIYLLRFSGFQISYVILKKLFYFSWPLFLSGGAAFFLAFGDRFFILEYLSLHDIGIYSLSYKFGFLLMVLGWGPIAKYWQVQQYEAYQQANSVDHFQKAFRFIALSLVLIGLSISMFSEDLIRLMANQEFWVSSKIVPIIILAYLFYALVQFCTFPLLITNNTKKIAVSTISTALIMVALYIVLIPDFGLFGAASATAIGFLVQLLLINIVGKILFDMKLPWLRFSLLSLLASATYLVSMYAPDDIWLSIMVKIILLVIFAFIIWRSQFLTVYDKQEVVLVFKGYYNKLGANLK